MSLAFLSSQKAVALVAAVLATVTLQGGLLASFDHVAETAQLQPSCRVVTLQPVEVVHARG